ncbi:hypothetical protein IV203_002976 [Nitzschia inconspicua]|uniref:Uncharacterized protein n=1 Tax=Nitzschia inconspicua TaxID=303405 RepID=A0A9K3PNU9_9STRA|nr:hypothetical protein IV203_002976 [Nitzschia inconspicua]
MSGIADEEQAASGIMRDAGPKTETNTQPGMAVVSGDEYVQHDAPKRRAHVCCGCCCDTRRAVIAVNIVSISFYGLGILATSLVTVAAANKDQYDDDAVVAALGEVDGAKIGLSLGLIVVGIVFNGIALYGASTFNKTAIILGGMWYIFEAVRSVAYLNIEGAIMAAFFAYPHAVFYYELKGGIMTRLQVYRLVVNMDADLMQGIFALGSPARM